MAFQQDDSGCGSGHSKAYIHSVPYNSVSQTQTYQAPYFSSNEASGYRSGRSSYSSSSSDYISRPTYSKTDYIIPHSKSNRHPRRACTGYMSSHSTSDYISPPVDSRHDYIAPKYNDTHQQQSFKPYYYNSRERDANSGFHGPQNSSTHRHASHSQINSPAPYEQKPNYRLMKDASFSYKHDIMRANGFKPSKFDDHDAADDIMDGFQRFDTQNARSRDDSQQPERYVRDSSVENKGDCKSYIGNLNDKGHLRDNSPGYGSDFETLVDHSDFDSENEHNHRRQRGYTIGSDIGSFRGSQSPLRHMSGSPITQPQHFSPPRSHYPYLQHSSTSPAPQRHSSFTKPVDVGSDVEDNQYTSDIEGCGSDYVSRGDGENHVGSDVCSNVGSRHGSVGGWDDEDTVDDGWDNDCGDEY